MNINKRIFGLDLLRAAAILFVVIDHGNLLLPDLPRKIADLFVFDGVAIFFVLSGYLIGGILLDKLDSGFNQHSLLDFWIRRWFRTLPNYYLILIVLVILAWTFDPQTLPSSILHFFFFTQGFAYPHPDFFPEAWSLAVEEWFYIITPVSLLLLISTRRIPRHAVVPGVVIMIMFTAMLLRYGRYIATPVINLSDWDLLFRKQVLTQLDSLMYGVLGAFLHRNNAVIWTRMPKTLLVTGVLIFFFSKFIAPRLFHVGGLYNCVFSFSVTSLATLLLLPFLTGFKSSTALVAKFVTHISLISYSMYLINLSLVKVWILDQPLWEDWPGSDSSLVLLKYTLYWVLVVGLSSLIYQYFEQPIMKLRDRFSYQAVNTKEV